MFAWCMFESPNVGFQWDHDNALYYTGSYSGRASPPGPLSSRQGLIHSRQGLYSGLRVGYPSPTRYLVSRRMRTNLAHVSPICIYMNRRGLRDWNKFGRLSELGNLYGHTNNGRAYPYRCVCTYVCKRNWLQPHATKACYKTLLRRNLSNREETDRK